MNIPILLYHSVSDQATTPYRPWSMPIAEFELHMACLLEQGYQPMTLSSLTQAIRSGSADLPKRPVVLTFDDGMADFLSGAVPILKKYQFPATLYVATGYVGETSRWMKMLGEQNRPMLSWDEIASLENVEIAAHSHTHRQLDIIPLSQAHDEILISKKTLEQQLGRLIHSFAFPHGYHTEKLLHMVKDAGFTSACIVGHRMATDTSDLFALPRIIITSDVTTKTLCQYLQGVGLRNNTILNRVEKKIWRIFRQIKGQ